MPHKGPRKNTIIDILSGIRSACTYIGATRLKALSKCATFIRVNNTHTQFSERKNIKNTDKLIMLMDEISIAKSRLPLILDIFIPLLVGCNRELKK